MTPANAQYWYYLGRAKYNENRFQEAVDAFLQCLKLDAHNVKGWNNLGLARQGLGDNKGAMQDFEAAIRWQAGQDRPSAQPYLDLGDLLLTQGKLADAIGPLSKAAKLAPQNPKAHEELGRVDEQSAMLKQAQAELQKAVDLAPQVSSLHFELGRIYKKEGLSSFAQKEFAKCAAINRSSSTDTLETPNPDGPG
jgi:tetratricopeptide (TPR) repeat protein